MRFSISIHAVLINLTRLADSAAYSVISSDCVIIGQQILRLDKKRGFCCIEELLSESGSYPSYGKNTVVIKLKFLL